MRAFEKYQASVAPLSDPAQASARELGPDALAPTCRGDDQPDEVVAVGSAIGWRIDRRFEPMYPAVADYVSVLGDQQSSVRVNEILE